MTDWLQQFVRVSHSTVSSSQAGSEEDDAGETAMQPRPWLLTANPVGGSCAHAALQVLPSWPGRLFHHGGGLNADPRFAPRTGGWDALEKAVQDAAALQPCPWLVAVEPFVPHAWLLPRCSAMLHAASAGAVAAAMLAGIPQLACPLHFDQFLWVSFDLARCTVGVEVQVLFFGLTLPSCPLHFE